MIERDMLVEDLVNELPESVPFLIRRGIQAIACGAPIWGTLEEAARSGGYDPEAIDALVRELRELSRADDGEPSVRAAP